MYPQSAPRYIKSSELKKKLVEKYGDRNDFNIKVMFILPWTGRASERLISTVRRGTRSHFVVHSRQGRAVEGRQCIQRPTYKAEHHGDRLPLSKTLARRLIRSFLTGPRKCQGR